MNRKADHTRHARNIIKDGLILLSLFALLSFIDVNTAVFMSIIVTVFLLTRRVMLDYNPAVTTENCIGENKKVLSVPAGVIVFDLSKVPAIESLYRYISLITTLVACPRILVVRCSGIGRMLQEDIAMVRKILYMLKQREVFVIFSDVSDTLRVQLRQLDIENPDRENIFDNVSDALHKAARLRKQIFRGKSRIHD
ncbi:MAG TPA: hypothetical protein VG738_19365 [Chitinophagaceae bacterium]|nr:hypothetical protein [Chitinophagaceae bacterium]